MKVHKPDRRVRLFCEPPDMPGSACFIHRKGCEMSTALQPKGLLCELLSMPERTRIATPSPCFSWVPNDAASYASQTGFQILVATSLERLTEDAADLWNSGVPDLKHGWVTDSRSLHIPYAGKSLPTCGAVWWMVRTWNRQHQVSPWSEPQMFHTGPVEPLVPHRKDVADKEEAADAVDADASAAEAWDFTFPGYPLVESWTEPVSLVRLSPDRHIIDFGVASFGTLFLELDSPDDRSLTIALGEVLGADGGLNEEPGGSRRFRAVSVDIRAGQHALRVTIPPDERNTGPMAIAMPESVGEVMPFRYAEIRGFDAAVTRDMVRRVNVHYPFDDHAASFHSSHEGLNAIWKMCHHTIKATSFTGLYVDGDRERIPYEADAYINMLGHYACDREFSMARRTCEYLFRHPTWPTEWAFFNIMMAWADYEATGCPALLDASYDDLVPKTLIDLAQDDGLISTVGGRVTPELLARLFLSDALRDIVDWPQGERDGYDMCPVNTVVNAFYIHALSCMMRIARVLGKDDYAQMWCSYHDRAHAAFLATCFDRAQGVFVDGVGSTHASLHANMFPLAFDLVPPELKDTVADYVISRGMACSVYGAQFLLEALYLAGRADAALALMTSRSERSWLHMLDVGSTMTLEAWDNRFKPNQDWNHAWGAAPANVLPRYLMGIRPLEPGYGKVLIQPQLTTLSHAAMTLPTIRGTIHAFITHEAGTCSLSFTLPVNVVARVILPDRYGDCPRGVLDGDEVVPVRVKDGWMFDGVGSGKHCLSLSRI